MAELRTNEQIDKINNMRKLQGEALLPYEAVTPTTPAQPAATIPPAVVTPAPKKEGEEEQPEMTPDLQANILANQVIEEQEKAAKLLQQNETAEQKIQRLEAKNKELTAAAKPVELSLEEKQAIAKEILGVTDLTEVVKKSEIKIAEPSKEELEVIAQQRENNKTAYALKEGKFSKKELENFITDSKNKTELVFAEYLQSQLKEDSTLTEKEVREEFEEKYGLDQGEGTRKHKRGQTEINLLADNLMRQKHAKIIGFDSEYNTIEQNENSTKQTQSIILAKAPTYKKDVEQAYAEIGKVKISIGDKEYELEIPKEELVKQMNNLLTPEFSSKQIQAGWTKDQIKQDAIMAAKITNFDYLVKKAAEAYNLDHAKGTHGIPPKGELEKKDIATTARKATLNEHHGAYATQPTN